MDRLEKEWFDLVSSISFIIERKYHVPNRQRTYPSQTWHFRPKTPIVQYATTQKAKTAMLSCSVTDVTWQFTKTATAYLIFQRVSGCVGSAQSLPKILSYVFDLSVNRSSTLTTVSVLHTLSKRGRRFQTNSSRGLGASLMCYLGSGDACCERRFHGTYHRSGQNQ